MCRPPGLGMVVFPHNGPASSHVRYVIANFTLAMSCMAKLTTQVVVDFDMMSTYSFKALLLLYQDNYPRTQNMTRNTTGVSFMVLFQHNVMTRRATASL